ncbi:thiol-disulfide oxidoreductase DCC family protein [soil metagenome]
MDEAHLHLKPIVLYDGSCGLCHRSVKFLLRHERDAELLFAPLQGPTAAALRLEYPEIPTNLDTVVLVEAGHARLRSKAILHVAHHLRAPWSWAYAMRWFPAVIGDLSYRLIAAVRYRVWGRADECSLPSPGQRARFLP